MAATPFNFDANTRGGGRGPLYSYEKAGPMLVATTHGGGQVWASLVYQNTSGSLPQQVNLQVHNLSLTPPSPSGTVSFVQLFIVEAADTVGSPQNGTEILNIGLLPTETWFSPRPYILYPGEILLAYNSSGQPCSVYADAYTAV